jgi:nicotinate-nucleotide pyrophosphorylase (carboxylating)
MHLLYKLISIKVRTNIMLAEPLLINKLTEFLVEDLGYGDITTDTLIDEDVIVKAEVICKEEGIVAGLTEASILFKNFGCSVKALVKDGEKVRDGSKLLLVEGPARSILKVERTALNILMRMSGIATETVKLVQKVRKANPKVRVAATRKTAPGLRFFDKKAVKLGGGDPHRMSLDDAILIKDNHLRLIGSIKKAVKLAKAKNFNRKVEVEVNSVKEAVEAAKAGSDIILLDNLTPSEVKTIVESLIKRKLRDKVVLEVSGGVTLDNAAKYAKTGIDVISAGYITHSAKALDISLEIVG